MRTPSVKDSTERLRGLSTYSSAKLSTVDEFKDLAALLDQGEADLGLAETGLRAAVKAALVQQAFRDQADSAADTKTNVLFNGVRSADGVSGGKAGRKQRRLFPNGLLGVTAIPIAEQPGAMAVLAGLLATEDDKTLAVHAPVISAAGEKLKAAVEAYDAATHAVALATAQMRQARETWIRLYEKVYGELVSRVGKRSAEAYFKAPKKLPKPKDVVLAESADALPS